jgi:type II secretory pathway pseudopilin PulG
MKVGGYRRAEFGFTIVETLIVLAVSALLVASAIILISGRTSKTEFTTATNDLKQQLQQIMNETATGYFPNSGSFTCAQNGGNMPKLTNASSQQGTNGDCIFLGKVMQFGATDSVGNMQVYSITGNRLTPAKTEVTTLAEAKPEAVAPGTSSATNLGLNGITTVLPLENGLTPAKMTYGSSINTSGFALLTTFANYTAGGSSCNGVCSGAQGLTLYAINGPILNNSANNTMPKFVDTLDSSLNYVATPTVSLCFNSGTTKQSVTYTIGTSGNSQGVDMQVQSGVCP